jgi:hypothetical protein
MAMHNNPDALEWDDRTLNKGVENEGFSRPSQELIEYARANHIRMNLWSRVVQRMLRLRMQGLPAAPHKPSEWLPWM